MGGGCGGGLTGGVGERGGRRHAATKLSVLVHAQGIKTVHAGGGGSQKMAKFCPRSF